MYVLNVYQYLKPGTREAFLEQVREQEICLLAAAEPGCIQYAYYTPDSSDGEEHVLLMEKWESRDAQQAHLKMEAFRRLQSFSGKYVLRSALEAFTTQDA